MVGKSVLAVGAACLATGVAWTILTGIGVSGLVLVALGAAMVVVGLILTGLPRWFWPLIWWGLGSVVVGLFLTVGASALTTRTAGGTIKLASLIGGGQLLPGTIGSLIVAEGKLLWRPGRLDEARTLVGLLGLGLVGFGAYFWGDIRASSTVDSGFIVTVSLLFYEGALLIVGSCVVLSEA